MDESKPRNNLTPLRDRTGEGAPETCGRRLGHADACLALATKDHEEPQCDGMQLHVDMQ